MKNSRIKYEKAIATHNKKEYQFTDFTRNVNLIPDEFFKNPDYYGTILVENDLNFGLASLSLYGKEDYYDLLMLFNNTTDPLALPKSEFILSKMVDERLNSWLSRYSYKGNDEKVPDLKLDGNVWYTFIVDRDSTKIENEAYLSKIEILNTQIQNLANSLNLKQEEYDIIKDDSSDYGGFKRKNLRNDMDKMKENIFNLQTQIMDIEEEGIEPEGEWVPIRQKDVDKMIDKNTSAMIKSVYNKMWRDIIKENEKFRYIKYPRADYLARIMDYINKGIS